MDNSFAKGKTMYRYYHHFINIRQNFENKQVRYKGPMLTGKNYCVCICSYLSLCSFEWIKVCMSMWSCMYLLSDICEIQRTTMDAFFSGGIHIYLFVCDRNIFMNCIDM